MNEKKNLSKEVINRKEPNGMIELKSKVITVELLLP